MKIVIIGSGMMGSAMAVPALDNGHTVTLVGTPLDTEIIDGLKERNYHKTLKRELKGDISCISFELADRIHTEVAFCGKDKDILNGLRAALKTEYYHISVTDDIAGIETAVALKNAYAMAVSLAIGAYTKNDPSLPEKYNAQAGLFYEAAREMRAIIKLSGGQDNALMFGVGDLYVTVFGGRTRRLGVILGSGTEFTAAREMLAGVTLESVAIIELLGRYFGSKISEYPLMQHIHERIRQNTLPDIPWDEFICDYFSE